MKKITKIDFSKKLAKYGALSLAIAGVADASGQIVYTDVDPDFVGGLGSSFAVDFDGDGVDDLTVLQSNNGAYELVKAQPGSSSAGVLAASNSGYFYASNLAYGAAISAGAGSFRSFGSLCAGVGYAGSQFCGAGESFIGVEFSISGDTHYGWIRVDVTDSSNFKVLDYAYESTPDLAIAAGDMTLSVSENNFQGFKYFVANSQLNLSANTQMQQVVLHNMLGQQVVSQKLSSNNEIIELSSLQPGVYIATIFIEGANKTFKIVKN